MKAPDRLWIWWTKGEELLEAEVTAHERPQAPASECKGIPPFCDEAEYIRKGAFPVERLKIESEKPRDAAEAALTAELRWVINEVLSILEDSE